MEQKENELDRLVTELEKEAERDSLYQAMLKDSERMQRGEQPVSADAQYKIHWWIDIAKGNKQLPNEFACFIALWEAFNGWLRSRRPVKQGQRRPTDSSLLRGVTQEEKVLQHFLKLQDSSANYRQTLKSLKEMCPVSEVWGGQTTERKWSIRHPYEFSEVLELVYAIRCNLFHGGKKDDPRDLKLSKLAFGALYPLFIRILKDPEITFVPVRSERPGQ